MPPTRGIVRVTPEDEDGIPLSACLDRYLSGRRSREPREHLAVLAAVSAVLVALAAMMARRR